MMSSRWEELTQTTLFLGAGASVPYGLPTTKKILHDIQNKHYGTSDRVLQTLVTYSFFPDIEYLLEAIQNILKFKESPGGKYFYWLSTFKNPLITAGGTQMSYHQFLNEFSKINSTLQKEVFDTYKLNKENVKTSLIPTLGPIINFLKSHSDNISIFTTNYDSAVEEYVQHCSAEYCLVDGFKPISRRFVFQPKVFTEVSESTSLKPVFLYKLHGSLDWVKTNGEIHRQSVESNFVEDDYQNMLIYPALSPKDDLHETPYSALFEQFEINMQETDALIVIGYSFRDEDIRNKIYAQFVSSKKKLVILSPTGISDYYTQLLRSGSPLQLGDELNPDEHTLILNKELTPETVVEIFSRIGVFLAGKTDMKP